MQEANVALATLCHTHGRWQRGARSKVLTSKSPSALEGVLDEHPFMWLRPGQGFPDLGQARGGGVYFLPLVLCP